MLLAVKCGLNEAGSCSSWNASLGDSGYFVLPVTAWQSLERHEAAVDSRLTSCKEGEVGSACNFLELPVRKSLVGVRMRELTAT